jgi:hypothetical protein
MGFGRAARAVTAMVATVMVLLLGYFASSPSLHQRVHTDSNRPDHFCAIFAFAKENLSGAAGVSLVAVALVFCFGAFLPYCAPLVSLFDFYLSPNRGPPRL